METEAIVCFETLCKCGALKIETEKGTILRMTAHAKNCPTKEWLAEVDGE